LRVAVISRHSVLTAALPRQWNLVIMRLNFVLAKTGSIIGCRLPYGAEIGTLYAERYPKRIRQAASSTTPPRKKRECIVTGVHARIESSGTSVSVRVSTSPSRRRRP
jgi:hypothetical protein